MMGMCRFTNIASLSSIPVTYLEREYGFWQCYLLTTVALAVGLGFFVIWSNRFVRVSPQGNVLPKASKTMLCAAKNGFKMDRARPLYQQEKFGRSVPWTEEFVEEIRKGLVACRVM